MTKKAYTQGDLFENTIFPMEKEWRLMEVEQKQDTLRKGLFKRWREQEEKIKNLSNEIRVLSGILEGALDKIS